MIKAVRQRLAGALMCSALVASCSSISADGPLKLGGEPGQLCVPEPNNADATVGEVIKNTGPSTVTLHEVSLVDAESLSTLQAYAIPLAEGDTAIGSGTTNPTNAQQKALWETRRKPSSVVLDAGESANVVVVVSLENGEAEGSAAAMKIEYSANDEKYSAESSTELLLRRDSCDHEERAGRNATEVMYQTAPCLH